MYLHKLCRIFDILPRSLVLESTLIERENRPFATGGYSDISKAIIGGHVVAVKTLRVYQNDFTHLVSDFGIKTNTITHTASQDLCEICERS